MCSRASKATAARWATALRVVVSAACAALCLGCISMQAPEGFLVIERGGSSLKAIAPDESRVWVRTFDDAFEGDRDFWAQALKNDFIHNRGYTLIEEGTAKDGEGHDGIEYVFEATVGGAPRRYLIDLFVIEDWGDDTICVVEFTARKPEFEKHLTHVRAAVATLRP